MCDWSKARRGLILDEQFFKGLWRAWSWWTRMCGSSKGFWAWSSKNDERWTNLQRAFGLDLWRTMNGSSKGFWAWSSRMDERCFEGLLRLDLRGGWTDLQGLLRLDLEGGCADLRRAFEAWSSRWMNGSSRAFEAWSWRWMCGSSKGFWGLIFEDGWTMLRRAFEAWSSRWMNACFKGRRGLILKQDLPKNEESFLDSSGFAWERLEFQSFKAFV